MLLFKLNVLHCQFFHISVEKHHELGQSENPAGLGLSYVYTTCSK